MYVYNSILAGRLGDCWLAPGRLLASPWEGWLAPGKLLAGPWQGWLALGKPATAGCTWRLLAGPWEGCWVCWIADFCWFYWLLVLLSGGWSSKLMLIFRCSEFDWKWWAWHHKMFENWLVTQSIQQRVNLKKMAIWPPVLKMWKILDFTNF